MFGEQYHLSVDDQSLTEVLRKHIQATGREVEIDTPVKRSDGSRGIVDLMFSRNIQLTGAEDREHLVVELKRPTVKVDSDAAAQIKSYAFAVADDERFRSVPAKWIFWAVSNDIDNVVEREVAQRDRAHGMAMSRSVLNFENGGSELRDSTTRPEGGWRLPVRLRSSAVRERGQRGRDTRGPFGSAARPRARTH